MERWPFHNIYLCLKFNLSLSGLCGREWRKMLKYQKEAVFDKTCRETPSALIKGQFVLTCLWVIYRFKECWIWFSLIFFLRYWKTCTHFAINNKISAVNLATWVASFLPRVAHCSLFSSQLTLQSQFEAQWHVNFSLAGTCSARLQPHWKGASTACCSDANRRSWH